jgi:ribosome-binding factor A
MRRDRASRVGDEMRKVISDILRNEVKDPRIPVMTSVLEVKMSNDLSHAKVFLSVMTDDKGKQDFRDAITSASGFIRREVAQRVSLRTAPEIQFVFDDSIEKGMKLIQLINETIREDDARE